MPRSKITAIIPARYASQRFPGKLLQPILGTSVLQRTYESTKRCDLIDKIFIATDDSRIATHAEQFGAPVLMTSVSCPTGTDRIVEALDLYPQLFSGTEIIVNIQGDEPCIGVENITSLIQVLQQHPQEIVATVVTKIKDDSEKVSSSVVKCVFDYNYHALYFSRSLIPGVKPGSLHKPVYFKHIGIYGFRKEFLLHYKTLKEMPLQQSEDLEQLKVLEAGYKIKVVEGTESTPHVDTPEDVQKVTQWLCTLNTSL